ncbi:hypothetical protein [Nocardia sp. NPDC050175]|uniref:hypothetical protein n=1 Tax=Nocardia sp. NPDC050175 TaxID=3364317 RepID=UPI0037A9C3D4
MVAAVSIVAAALVAFSAPSGAAPNAGVVAVVDAVPAGHIEFDARYTATVKCQLIKDGAAVGYITGTGSDNTKPGAVAAAKKDADRSVPQGHYKRHCKEI